MAIRVARGYRTISRAAAAVLSGIPPIELLAQMYDEVYRRTRAQKKRGVVMTDRMHGEMRHQARWLLLNGSVS